MSNKSGELLGALLLCAVAYGFKQWNGSNAEEQIRKTVVGYSLEQKIVFMDEQTPLSKEDDLTVNRTRYLLSNLSKTTGLQPEKIADMIAKTRDLTRDNYGRDVKLIDLLEMANRSDAIQDGTMSLSEFLALHLVLDNK